MMYKVYKVYGNIKINFRFTLFYVSFNFKYVCMESVVYYPSGLWLKFGLGFGLGLGLGLRIRDKLRLWLEFGLVVRINITIRVRVRGWG